MVIFHCYEGWWLIHWIGFVGKIYRKPWFLPSIISHNPILWLMEYILFNTTKWNTLRWTNIAIENGPVEIVDFPIKHGGSFHCYEGWWLIHWIGFVGNIYRKPWCLPSIISHNPILWLMEYILFNTTKWNTLRWTNIAIENGPVEIVDFPIKHGGSFHCYVSSPEGILFNTKMVIHDLDELGFPPFSEINHIGYPWVINGIYPVGNEWAIVHGKMNDNGDLLAYIGIIWNIDISHMLHGAGICTHIWVILFGQMLVNIPAPWSIWVSEAIWTYLNP